jgi:hypothetical protein
MTPWAIQEYIWAKCYSGEGGSQALLDCESPVSQEEALAVLEQFRQSPELLGQLRFWMATNGTGTELLANIQRDAQDLAQAIEQSNQ